MCIADLYFSKLKYAIFSKDLLEDSVDDLERWQRTFDPSWIIIARISSSTIDDQILDRASGNEASNKSVSIVKGLRDAHRSNLEPVDPRATIFLWQPPACEVISPVPFSRSRSSFSTKHGTPIILDMVPYRPNTDLVKTTKDVRDLARVLAQVDPVTCCLLACQGVVKAIDPSNKLTGFEFIFSVPAQYRSCRSLRDLLLHPSHLHTLTERFELAKSLTRSIIFLHNASIVHKNICPETVLVMQDTYTALGKPFLVGFEKSRFIEGRTYLFGDDLWEKNLYRHPRRQGPYPEEEYKMQHDLYSLGVCLLEIGMWSSFVTFDESSSFATPGASLDIVSQLAIKDLRKRAFEIKSILFDMAEKHLPGRMGNKYANVAMSCLACLDKGNAFGNEDEFLDEDGVEVGVRYIAKVSC